MTDKKTPKLKKPSKSKVIKKNGQQSKIVTAELMDEDHAHVSKRSTLGRETKKSLLPESDPPNKEEEFADEVSGVLKSIESPDDALVELNELEKKLSADQIETLEGLDTLEPVEVIQKFGSTKPGKSTKVKSSGSPKKTIKKESKLPAVILESLEEGKSQRALVQKDPLSLYLSEIRKYPLLSREDELALAKSYFETKNPDAAQTLVQSNLRFVVKIAAEYSKFGSKLIDLIQEGNIGLMHAVREFNPYRGTRLISYAVWWIRGYIQEFLMRQYSLVRIGTTQNQRKLFYQLQKQKNLLDSVDFETNIEAISQKLGIPQDEVRDMAQRLSQRDLELDRPLSDDSSSKIGDIRSSHTDEASMDDVISKREELSILNKKVAELRPELNEREIILLEERILNEEPLTLQEIGEKYGITREAVRQAEVRLMKKIKDKMSAP